MDLPDLRNPDPDRTSRTPESTVFYDLIPCIKDIGDALAHLEQEGEMAAVVGVMGRIDLLIEVAQDFKRNLRVIQYEMNRPKREYAKLSREERKAMRDAIRNEAIREKWLEMRKRYAEERERKRAIARQKREERREANRQNHYQMKQKEWRERYPPRSST